MVTPQLNQAHCHRSLTTVYIVCCYTISIAPPLTQLLNDRPRNSNILTENSFLTSRTHIPLQPRISHKPHKHSTPVTEPCGLPSQHPHNLAAAQHFHPQQRRQNWVQQQQVYCSAVQREHDLVYVPVLVFRIHCSPAIYCSRVRRSNTSLSDRHGLARLLQNLGWLRNRIQGIWL